MKVLVRIDQASAIAMGFDAPNSTSRLEFNPKDLREEHRALASELFASHKDDWSSVITVVTTTPEELVAALNKLHGARQEEAMLKHEAEQKRTEFQTQARDLVVKLLKQISARDKVLLRRGTASVSGPDFFERNVEVSYEGHYIQVEDKWPDGTDPNPFWMKAYDLDAEPTPLDEALSDRQVHAGFTDWQRELTAANDHARHEAERKLAERLEAIKGEAVTFIRKSSHPDVLLRLKQFGPSHYLVERVLRGDLLKDYPTSSPILGDDDEVKKEESEPECLDDDQLRGFLELRDNCLHPGDTLRVVYGGGEHFGVISRSFNGIVAEVAIGFDLDEIRKSARKTKKARKAKA